MAVFDQFRVAAAVGHDRGDAVGHGLDDRAGEAFAFGGRQAEDVTGGAPRGGVRLESDAVDAALDRAVGDAVDDALGLHVADQHQVRGHVGRQFFERFDQVLDSFARTVGGRARDRERALGDAGASKVDRRLVVPREVVTLVDRDRSLRGHPQERRLHVEEVAPDRVAHADNAIDTGVQVARPRHRVEEAHVADDPAVRDDLDRQPARRAQSVRQRAAVERVHDVEAAALQQLAQSSHALPVEALG